MSGKFYQNIGASDIRFWSYIEQSCSHKKNIEMSVAFTKYWLIIDMKIQRYGKLDRNHKQKRGKYL